MKRALVLLFTMLIVCTMSAYSQEQQVRGMVSSSDGKPIHGATVKIQGLATGTSTDENGQYEIKVSIGQILHYSYVGMLPVTRTVGNATAINVILTPDNADIEEVVVTALGIERSKKNLTYSVQQVSGDDLRAANQGNIINALQGKVAGAQISSSGGSPGLPSEIILRGSTTLTGDNQPLIIIDGIRVNNSSSNGTVNRLADFNAEDIEDISILKGAAAAALYGIDAASGAVIITTKKGKSGAIEINGSYKSFLETMGRTPRQQAIYTVGTGGTYDPSTAMSWGRKFRYDEPIYDNITNFFQTGITHDVNVNVNGGSERFNYYVSGGYRDAGSMIPNTDQKKLSLMVKGTAKLSSKVDLTTSANYVQNNILEGLSGASTGGWINNILTYPLMYDIMDYQLPNGEPSYTYIEDDNLVTARISPLWGVMRNPRNNDVDRFVVNNKLTYRPVDWVTLSYQLGQDYTASKYRNLTSPGTPGQSNKGYLTEITGNSRYVTSIFNALFDRKINNDFRATLILGGNSDWYSAESLRINAENFLVKDIFSVNVAENIDPLETKQQRQRYAVYGDFKLEYKNLLTLGVTGRNDWTSTLSPQHRQFYSPSYSGSFTFSELFAANSWYGKLRASYAKVGKDAPIYRTNTNLRQVYTEGGGFVVDATGGNPDLKPERTEELEYGAELSFFNRRLNVDLAYYQRKSLDMIMTPRVPLPSGTVIMTFNAGSLENKGYEISLNGIPLQNDNFKWSTTVNLWKNNSKMLEFAGDIVTFIYTNAQLTSGKAASSLHQPVLGIVGTDYKRNEDGYIIIDKNTGWPTIDNVEKYIGNREPEFNIGWINNLNYKDFSLSFLWDFRFGGDILNASRQRMMSLGTAYDIGEWRDKEFVFNGVVQQDDGTYVKNAQTTVMDYAFFANNYYQVGTNFVEKVNWARVRYITLGYKLPSAWATRLGLSGINVEFSAQNPIIITNYSGGDPEVNSAGPNAGGSGASTMGVDNGAIPLPKSYSLGLNIRL